MSAFFRVASLLLTVAVLGLAAAKFLQSARGARVDQAAAGASVAEPLPAGSTPVRAGADGEASVAAQSRRLQDMARERSAAALQQGAARTEAADR